jgi:hypothetical protein
MTADWGEHIDLDTEIPVDIADDERAKLHAALQRAEEEIAAGGSTPAEDLIRELRAAR